MFNGFDQMTSNDEKIDGPPNKKKPFFSASSEDVTGSYGGFGDMLGSRPEKNAKK